MKTYLYVLLLGLGLTSCTDAGTLVKVDKGNNDKIEVFKYYYDDGDFVYVARFKNEPNVVTTTWKEQHGKTSLIKSNVTIYENDSIQVILKKH